MTLVHTTYHPGTERPPVLVAIHGHGANGHDLLGLGPYLAAGRVLLLCPEAEFVLYPGMLSFTWFNRDESGKRTPEEFERVAGLVRAFIDEAVPRYGGDPERVALLGFSQGGSLAYRLGLAEPSRWCGVAVLSTWLPDEAAAAANRDDAGLLPFLVLHGTEDPMIAIDRARESRDRLAGLGVTAEYHEYMMGHEIRPEALRDLSAWLEQIFELPAV